MSPNRHRTLAPGAPTRITAIGTAAALVVALFGGVGGAQPVAAATAGGSECGATVNKIACENSKPGSPWQEWDVTGAGDTSIQGFATEMSVNAGSSIGFKVDTDSADYDIEIYRTGWYGGDGARHITSVTPSAPLPQVQPECITDVTTELYDCGNWGVSASWNVPANAVSGVYLAVLQRKDGIQVDDRGGRSHIIFVVRNDWNTSDVVFQTSDTTWQAYNWYGGSDFYQGAANGRAYKISYNRPIVTRESSEWRSYYFSSEYATVRFLERNGYDMSYIAGVDSDRRGGELLNHKVFLSVGHDEYWSGAQRANVEAARDAGVNLQFLTGNEAYWRTRYEPSIDGSNTPYRTIVSYKETWAGAKIDPSREWTGTWRDPRFADASQGGHLPENNLTGTMYVVNTGDLAVSVTAEQGKTRLWRNAGLGSLASGTSAVLAPHTIGYESNEDLDNGYRPEGLIRLSTTVGPVAEYMYDYGASVEPRDTEHHVTLYRAASGALVFSAASIQWGWGLDETHDGSDAPADRRMQQAQVNLLADMGAQPTTLMQELVRATASTDHTAPTTAITAPVEGATVAHGTPVTVTGTASDADGVVAGVEVSTDGGASWHPADGTTRWTYSYILQGTGTATIRARAIDDSANFSATGVTRTLSVTGPYSLLGAATPAQASVSDTQPVELGLRFTPETDGFVTGVRFYKGAANTGTHVGSLWSPGGERLADVVFANESTSGWQTASFVAPVEVYAGVSYTVSYTAANGGYAADARYWPYGARTTSPLTVHTGTDTENPGVYGYAGQFPARSYSGTNYYVDVVFDKSDTSPLRIAGRTPAADEGSVELDKAVTATFTRAADPTTVSLTVAGPDGTPVEGTFSYDVATRTARFAPAKPYAPSTRYTVTPTGTDVNGVALAAGSVWSFTTQLADLPEGQCPCSLFPESTRPAIESAADPASVSLGVRFTVDEPGTITAIKYYKSAGNRGAHTGAVWNADGTLLGSVSFDGESTSGWQVATLDTPVRVVPGVTYVASYIAPQGGYSATPGQLTSGLSRGPLSVPANGGAFSYGGAFPASSSSSGYLVDVTFERSNTGPSVTATTPAAGAGDVDAAAAVTATFDAPVADGFTGSVTANGTAVAGAWKLSQDRLVATFTPQTGLRPGSGVVVALRGIEGVDGRKGSDVTWSFSVAVQLDPSVTTFFAGQAPQVPAATSDGSSVELGLAFTSSVDGEVRAVRFYKGATNLGQHTGSVWDANGNRIASVTFEGETASGWQRAEFAQPVRIVAGATYTVSYLAPRGNYAYTPDALSSSVTSGPLTSVAQSNGRFQYGSGGTAPTATWNASNYFVDLEFVADAAVPPPDEPTIPAGAKTLFGSETPSTDSMADTAPVEVGTAFTVSRPGAVTAVRFYKGSQNNGVHRGTLWSSDGRVLARVTFENETATGWQRAALTEPVELQSGTSYVVSYFAPAGGYSHTGAYFSSEVVRGDIVAPAGLNGRFTYGDDGGFPTGSWNSSAYFVDAEIVFRDGPSPSTEPSPTASPSPDASPSSSLSPSASPSPDPGSTQDPAGSVGVQTLFGTAEPLTPPDNETWAVELGTAFRTTKPGRATAIRFYKAASNTGVHRGTLWSETGDVLAQVTFEYESATGWQRAELGAPVELQPGETYVVSYLAPAGGFSMAGAYFATEVVSGDIVAVAGQNGRFLYGADGGFPTGSWNSTAYFVDAEIDFTGAPVAPSPAPGADGGPSGA